MRKNDPDFVQMRSFTRPMLEAYLKGMRSKEDLLNPSTFQELAQVQRQIANFRTFL